MRLNAFPSSQRRGGCAEGADGVVGPAQYLAELTTPARQLLLSCRATPPLRGGECSALRLLSWFLCLLLLSACSVGPKYKTPAAPVPPAFKEPPPANFKENGEWKQAAPQDDSIRGDWWEIFGDPQLNDLE